MLPVGISFYTFQTMSYSLDVYFGRLRPTRRVLDVALFVAFFPQLVAGPIVRAAGFIPKLASTRIFPSASRARELLVLFLAGFFKKACVSDNLDPYVDKFFEDPGAFGAAAAWTAIMFYAVQIYCDFSGYSDMAIACAGLLGYQLAVSFAFPYFAGSITDFWRRWHMSLSTLLRDYLCIPLGGNRGGRIFTFRNLMLAMLLGGLWHGAAWNFVLWGGLHGVALAVHRRWPEATSGAGELVRRTLAALGPLLISYWVCITWIFFRAETLSDAILVLESFVFLKAPALLGGLRRSLGPGSRAGSHGGQTVHLFPVLSGQLVLTRSNGLHRSRAPGDRPAVPGIDCGPECEDSGLNAR